jgi:hypothetical protein
VQQAVREALSGIDTSRVVYRDDAEGVTYAFQN